MKGNLVFTQYLDVLYTTGDLTTTADPFYGDLVNFYEIITYRNPRMKHHLRSVTLMEMMGLIRSHSLQIEYLQRNLPSFEI